MEQQYLEKCKQYDKLEEEYNLFLEESQALEQAQEDRIQDLEKQLAWAQNKNVYSNDEIAKLKLILSDVRKENTTLQNKLEKVTMKKDTQINELQIKQQQLSRKVVDLEIDLDQETNRNRELVEAIKDMEAKLDKVLEQYALTQTDLEVTKSTLQDEIERLQQQLKDNREELFVVRHQRFSCSSNTTPDYVKMPTIDTVRANAAGFNKSLTLISALIKDLDEKMCLIRHQKA